MTTTEAPQWGTQSSALAKVQSPEPSSMSVFTGGIAAFESAQRMAAALCSSTMVPDSYQGQRNLGNCLVALDLANRMGVSPLAIMQNMEPIYGRPAFRSSFLIAMINSCGRFTPLEFHFDREDDPTSCYAAANTIKGGVRLVGQKVTVKMAKAEGWWDRKGSKWPNMTGQMLTYRAASFWQRIHAPELTVGFRTADEVIDVESVSVTEVEPVAAAAQAPEPEPVKPARTRASRARATQAPAPAAEAPAPAEVVETQPEPTAPAAEPTAPEPASEAKDPRRGLGSLPAEEPAAPQNDEPIDVAPLGDFAQEGMKMIVQQCQVSGLEEFAGQVHAFAKAGNMTEGEGERLLAAILTRKGYLLKALTPFEVTAAVTKIQGTAGLEQRFRDAFGLDAETPLAELVTDRQHVETVKVLLSAEAS